MQNDNSKIIVGSLVTAIDDVSTGAYKSGEAGVCFQVGGVGAWHDFIFERGGYVTGLGQKSVMDNFEISGRVSQDAAGYEYKGFEQVERDYDAGRFDSAFEEQKIEKAQERSAWPHPRDILRREYDENLRRESAGIEPKRDMDFDLDK